MHLFSKLFSSKKYWDLHKSSLIFKSKSALDDFQYEMLRRICSIHNTVYSEQKIQTDILPMKPSGAFWAMQSSGTQSGCPKKYTYPKPFYELIENHHIWRIEQSHELTNPGKVLSFRYNEIINFNVHETSHYYAAGLDNNVWIVEYSHRCKDWDKISKSILEGGYKYVIASPTEIQLLYFNAPATFQCPVISTRETLMPHVKEMALQMFPKVINKMRCWDGGLSFYSCDNDRLHIYDELCYVENDGVLISTDFYNYCHPFIKYANGDAGIIEEGMCTCGIYGKYFTEFQGRYVDAIKLGHEYVAGTRISMAIQTVLGKLKVALSYKLVQESEKLCVFNYCGNIQNQELALVVKTLELLTKSKIQVVHDVNLLRVNSKNCTVKSKLLPKFHLGQ